ncbi:MAG: hypothetical protein H7A25_17000 [Leptospiraceae bacterium]|nr:hypothetical protein [Leptospiraceae bacterium]
MNRETIIDEESASLYFYPELKVIHHSFHKFLNDGTFRRVLTKGADLFIKHNCKKWLSDDRQSPIIKKEDLDWGVQHWTPRVTKAGWKYWAIILPDKEVGKIMMKPLIEEYSNNGITVKIFNDDVSALKWLSQQ